MNVINLYKNEFNNTVESYVNFSKELSNNKNDLSKVFDGPKDLQIATQKFMLAIIRSTCVIAGTIVATHLGFVAVPVAATTGSVALLIKDVFALVLLHDFFVLARNRSEVINNKITSITESVVAAASTARDTANIAVEVASTAVSNFGNYIMGKKPKKIVVLPDVLENHRDNTFRGKINSHVTGTFIIGPVALGIIDVAKYIKDSISAA